MLIKVNILFCPQCGSLKYWLTAKHKIHCSVCGKEFSITSGTIFQESKKPLLLWFHIMWWIVAQKTGASAYNLKDFMGFGSYETAWTWLHKLRRAMVRTGRGKLSGTVEVDETYIGGNENGSTVITDGWPGYTPLRENKGYEHIEKVISGSGKQAHELLPHVHMVDSLVKQWIKGTHQGEISPKHLEYYLDEFAFRFNQKLSTHRGKLFYRLMQQAVTAPPVTYKIL
jgi:hypothetical protein